jgi:hypothetical protein
MKISTATCTSSDVIIGTSHLKFRLRTENDSPVEFCSNFVITNKLNGLECILGAEFLLDEERVVSISASKLVVKYNSLYYMLPITSEIPPTLVNFVSVNNTLAEDIQHFREDTWTEEDSETPLIPEEIDITEKENAAPMAYHFNHNIEADFENETLPPSEQFFDNTYELKFESLEKKLTLEDADYTDCPQEYIGTLKTMLYEYDDRFSKSKLDLETTTLYEASLPTLPGRIVTQRVRRLPPHKYNFAIQAIKQLQESGVVRESDSP